MGFGSILQLIEKRQLILLSRRKRPYLMTLCWSSHMTSVLEVYNSNSLLSLTLIYLATKLIRPSSFPDQFQLWYANLKKCENHDEIYFLLCNDLELGWVQVSSFARWEQTLPHIQSQTVQSRGKEQKSINQLIGNSYHEGPYGRSPYDCKEIKTNKSKNNLQNILWGRTDNEAEAPVFGSYLIKMLMKDLDAGKD